MPRLLFWGYITPRMKPRRIKPLPDRKTSKVTPMFWISLRTSRIEYANNMTAGMTMTRYQMVRWFHQ